MKYFVARDYQTQPQIGNKTFVFQKAGRNSVTSGWYGVLALEGSDAELLAKNARGFGVFEVTKEEYDRELKKNTWNLNIIMDHPQGASEQGRVVTNQTSETSSEDLPTAEDLLKPYTTEENEPIKEEKKVETKEETQPKKRGRPRKNKEPD